MASQTPVITCRKNKKNKDHYTNLKSRNGKKILTLGEGFRKKFTEQHRQMLIKALQEAVIVYK